MAVSSIGIGNCTEPERASMWGVQLGVQQNCTEPLCGLDDCYLEANSTSTMFTGLRVRKPHDSHH